MKLLAATFALPATFLFAGCLPEPLRDRSYENLSPYQRDELQKRRAYEHRYGEPPRGPRASW